MKNFKLLIPLVVFSIILLAGCGLKNSADKPALPDEPKENSAAEVQKESNSAESAVVSENSGDQFDQEAANIDKELGNIDDSEFDDKELSDAEIGL